MDGDWAILSAEGEGERASAEEEESFSAEEEESFSAEGEGEEASRRRRSILCRALSTPARGMGEVIPVRPQELTDDCRGSPGEPSVALFWCDDRDFFFFLCLEEEEEEEEEGEAGEDDNKGEECLR